jgi:hypothetical protein
MANKNYAHIFKVEIMSIFSIDWDIRNYRFFTVDDLDVCDKMEDFDILGFGEKLKFKWVAPKAFFIDNDYGSETLPDITCFGSTELVLNQTARAVLDEYIGDSGEYLALDGEAKEYCLFNNTRRIGNDIVNLEKTKFSYYDDGSFDRVQKLVLTKDASDKAPPLFTITLDNGSTLFCNQSFKDTVEKNNLKGLVFSPVEQA